VKGVFARFLSRVAQTLLLSALTKIRPLGRPVVFRAAVPVQRRVKSVKPSSPTLPSPGINDPYIPLGSWPQQPLIIAVLHPLSILSSVNRPSILRQTRNHQHIITLGAVLQLLVLSSSSSTYALSPNQKRNLQSKLERPTLTFFEEGHAKKLAKSHSLCAAQIAVVPSPSRLFLPKKKTSTLPAIL